MRSEGWGLGRAVGEFFLLLEKYPDKSEHLVIFRNFLKLFLRSKTSNGVLATVEVMTVLKHERPVVFSMLKKQANMDSVLNLLIQLEMDIEEARKRLHDIVNQAGVLKVGQESLSGE
ncbi:hypothetical protein DFP93_10679 [Aneurinibacillus soli]|uniref:Uncharacterized protein n=1 Tax=Aneurinibacillus soli TaxID=1500254 RepID=A0A0U5BDL8_9BACL|nr:hypothetical protein [Aneurinibacillus soli]PYE61886.1 hypothetical protein DFP93_10679 [Aneurinibacillus soli]BAU29702.1 hypothetical protein CB4_03939 [Aneurinibacillus soli]